MAPARARCCSSSASGGLGARSYAGLSFWLCPGAASGLTSARWARRGRRAVLSAACSCSCGSLRGLPSRRCAEALDAADASACVPRPRWRIASLNKTRFRDGDAVGGASAPAGAGAQGSAHIAAQPIAEARPYALRALACGAWGWLCRRRQKGRALRAAFDWRGAALRMKPCASTPGSIRRPIQAAGAGSGRQGHWRDARGAVNSILHVRFAGAAASRRSSQSKQRPAREGCGQRAKVQADGPARLKLPDGRAFEFAAIPDRPPSIELLAPRKHLRG